jgi:hypothetical protein
VLKTGMSTWKVQFVVPDGNLSRLMRFALGSSTGLPVGGSLAAIAMEKGVKLLHGGLPMPGRLAVDSTGLTFETSRLAVLISYDRPFAIHIPASEIVDARVPASFLNLDLASLGLRGALVVLRTTDGEYRIAAGFRAKRIAKAINAIRRQ